MASNTSKKLFKRKICSRLPKSTIKRVPKDLWGHVFCAVRARSPVPSPCTTEQVATNLLTTETEIMDISVIVVIGLVWSYLIFVGNQ